MYISVVAVSLKKFFQAEDGIRDALLSRGLGDVYKRQGFGYSPEYNIERYYRDAPLLAIGEGTNELQKLIIAKQLVSNN